MSQTKKKRVVPKRIAGVKVPKAVRRTLEEHLGSKNGRKLIGDAVLAAVAAIAAAQSRKGSAARRFAQDHPPENLKAAASNLKGEAKDAAAGAALSGAAIAYALGEAGRSFVDALQRHKTEADARAAWPPIEPAAGKPAEGPAAAH